MTKVYPDEYIETVFYLWYDGGCKTGQHFLNTVPDDPDGKPLSMYTLAHWVKSRGWVERADALSAEASKAKDDVAIERRRKMYEQQVQVADELVLKGMEYLREKGIQTDASAIRAVDLGLTTQRVSTGMAEAYVAISKMSDAQLSATLHRLLGTTKSEEDNIVDAEETVDVT